MISFYFFNKDRIIVNNVTNASESNVSSTIINSNDVSITQKRKSYQVRALVCTVYKFLTKGK